MFEHYKEEILKFKMQKNKTEKNKVHNKMNAS
jgi:hypothetical protein